MKKKQTTMTALRLAAAGMEKKKKTESSLRVGRLLSGGLMLAGFWGLLSGGPLLPAGLSPAAVIPGVLLLLTGALLHRTKADLWFHTGAMAVLLAWLLLRRPVLTGEFAALANRFLDFWTEKTGRLYLPVSGAAGTAAEAEALLGAMVSLLAASLPGGLALGALLLAGICTGVCGAKAFLLLYALGLMLLILGRQLRSRRTGFGSWAHLWQGAALAVLGALLLPLCLIPAASLTPATDWTVERLHELRFGAGSLPEGRLSGLGAWTPEEQTALHLSGENIRAGRLYLRGFTGELYTGSAWQALPGGTLKENSGLFYWLHQDGFYGQSAAGLAAERAELLETASLQVEPEGACRAYAYLPYGLTESNALDPMDLGDGSLRAAGRQTEAVFRQGSVPDFYRVQAALAQQPNGEAQKYLADESAYRAYCESVDLQLTPDAARAVAEALGEDDTPRTLTEIKVLILNCLDRLLHYDTSVRTRNGGQDFAAYLLERSCSGYSVHYATAATLMLRYCGVPARYVEGYCLTEEQTTRLAADGEAEISELSAHAWAEYYLDGVGWLPFETTPGYRDDEEIELLQQIFDPNSAISVEGEKTYVRQPPQEQPPAPDVVQPNQKPEKNGTRFSWAYVYGPVILLLLLACMLLALRRYRMRRAVRALRRGTPSQTAAGLFGYAVALMCRADFRPGPGGPLEWGGAADRWRGNDPLDFMDAARRNREAMFSAHVMQPSDTAAMERFLTQVLAICRKKWSLPRRVHQWLCGWI